MPIVDQNQDNKLDNEAFPLSSQPPTIKSEFDANENSTDDMNLDEKSPKPSSPRLNEQISSYEQTSPNESISNARIDMIDFITKCCLRLELSMAMITCSVKAYHKYQHYLDQGVNRWLIDSVDWRFDEELIAIACILLATKETENFKGISKTLNVGLRYGWVSI